MTDQLWGRTEELEREYLRHSRVDIAKAREAALAAMELTAGTGGAARALALRVYGNSLRAAGRLREALQAIREAKRRFRAAGDDIQWARTINAQIPILVGMGQNRAAMNAAEAALALCLRTGERAAAARLLNNMGAMYGNMGRPRKALDCFARCEELYREANQTDDEMRALSNRALVLQQLGRHRESLSVCAKVLRHYVRQGAKISAARTLQTGGIGLFHLGRFGKALRRFSKARQIFEAQSSARDVAVCDLYIAACYLELNRYDQTIARTRTVADVLDPLQNGFQHAWAHLYEGVALGRTGRCGEAKRLLTLACRWFTDHGHSAWAAKAHLEEADLLLSLGSPAEASRAAGKAARLFALAHMPTEAARAHLLRAESSLEAGRLPVAQQAVDAACPVFQRAHMPGPTFRCLHLQGRIAVRRRDWETARRLLTRAVATAERMRATVQVAFRQSFLDDKSSAYGDLVWVQLQQGRVRQAQRLADLAKSRALADQLAAPPQHRFGPADAAELELLATIKRTRREYQELMAPTQLGPEEAIAMRAGALSPSARRADLEGRLAALWDEWELRHIGGLKPARSGSSQSSLAHRALAPGAAMVEYFAAGSRLVAFVTDRRGLRGWVDLGSPERVRRTLELLQLNLDSTVMMAAVGNRSPGGLARNARALLQELHEALWAPLSPLLEARRAVVVIPHGILHLVPFEALYDGEQYLVQRHEISLAPSRAVWVRCRERAACAAPADGDLVIGYSVGGALPFVDAEARLVAGALGAELYLGEAATTERMGAGGARRIVHVAAHGEFRLDNPYFSTLLLADGPLTAADVAALRLQSALVVLSGCETGLSRVTRGEELMGMVTAFLQAGSAAVLASRWRVDDAVTADLMDRFYAGLQAGAGTAEALRSAQSAIAVTGVHPLYWAAFGLIGHNSSPVR